MDCTTSFLPYTSTGFFSNIVGDYLAQATVLRPFYEHLPNMEGIKDSIEARNLNPINRTLLVKVLEAQYKGLAVSDKVANHIQLLAKEQVYTVTTAHQPNIFTGPLYFIYKIMHAVKLSAELSAAFPDKKFVPVYYMGSEDADLDELGYINLGGQKLVWQTKQTGAVGRMKVDKSFIQLLHAIEGQIAVLPNGNQLVQLFNNCYTEGKMIQQATLELVNHLFANYGVIVLIPDNAALKAEFIPLVQKELLNQFSHSIVEKTANELSLHYKVQAAGRHINLFYLINDRRERIELRADGIYEVQALKLEFTKEAILEELQKFPERFSPNVILRGVFQETILPNIAFIGGGGELAYWLELKQVFKAAEVPYPLLVLRNSFLFIEKVQQDKWKKHSFNNQDLFTKTADLINRLVKEKSTNQLSLQRELAEAIMFYENIQAICGSIDNSLSDHVASLKVKALKKLTELEKKMLRAEKNKFEIAIQQITQLKQALFPENNLQERTYNFATLYATYGQDWMQQIYQSSTGLKQEFGIIVVN